MKRASRIYGPFIVIFMFVACAAVRAQTPVALINPVSVQPELPADAKVDQVLDALDVRGKTMKEFTAKVSLTEGDINFGDLKTSIGRVWFQKKGDDDGRIRVTFDKRKVGEYFRDEKVEYLLDNGLLIDRNYKKTNEDRRQVIKPGEKINLLKLGEGPFPLPIGQDKADVHREFDVQLIAPTRDEDKDLTGTIHLRLTPKPGTRFARRFSAIDIWVDRTTRFPAQIVTVAPDQSDQKTTKFTDVQINPAGGLKDSDFTLPPIDEKTWGIHTEKFHD
ncbi:MAG TPA: hypothetical protein VG326_04605 [Tepidisphaeraceae bacterium]|jgi:hypothetical protein|nr:hypothetical protein [Tepidisphaeraceae bacterium]